MWYLLNLAAREPGIVPCPVLWAYSGQAGAVACVGACVNLGKKGRHTVEPFSNNKGVHKVI